MAGWWRDAQAGATKLRSSELEKTRGPRWARLAVGATTVLASALSAAPVHAQQFDCTSPDPSKWPAAAKPYFLVMVDTSGSMTSGVGSNTTCMVGNNAYGSDRRAHARCAVKNTFLAYAGEVNFGLATFPTVLSGCSNNADGRCRFSGGGADCNYANVSNNATLDGCGPEPTNQTNSAARAGSLIRVPMLQDIGSPAPNINELLKWVDGECSDNREIFASGFTPLNGMLRDAFRYYSSSWTPPAPTPGGATLNSPLTSVANGERACRNVNVILVTDGDETCDDQADAADAAADLLAGFSKDGINWSVKTYVINFAGGSQADTDAIAAAGGTGVSYFANNETDLALAMSNIIAGSIAPETCNNTDDNCNGCIDEGYVHYCNHDQTCCVWNTEAERTACLDSYVTSLNSNPPDGNLSLLPCTTQAQLTDSAHWLCYNPGDECDNIDNNCTAGTDEGSNKCGSPAHCPLPETCDGQDQDCDGTADNGGVCGACVPSAEVCDGCDNDCDGFTDDGIAPVACGLASPPNCAGQITCKPPVAVTPGGCVAGGGFNACSNAPQTETCDGIDNDCDGVVDDSVAPTPCVPPNTPMGLVFGGTSQCVMGSQPCNGTCNGFVGPSAEICDGIDNDCDGVVDDMAFGTGQACGSNQAPCTPGVTACVNGALTCTGGTQPQAETCDGVDNDCDGSIDDAPLADAPLPGQNGCWQNPGNCCSFNGLTWCPPAGGTCNGVGTLTAPCNTGTLSCNGAQGWQCNGGTAPVPEVCDGVDNNCNAVIDDGNFPNEGQACGAAAPAVMGCTPGDCAQGVIQCTAGVLDCVGDVAPVAETCNGKDDNCDGTCDNGIPIGGACTPVYDTALYPGDRSASPCMPGVLQCDGNGGLVCTGGVGPSPEVCDGVDNDCDGQVDESGPAPDGLDGTDNPFPPPDAAIGDVCGTDVGKCSEGAYSCVNGMFTCVNSQGPQPEQCDCQDNDCDGNNDNPNPGNNPPLCGQGSDCVASGSTCQCAQPCGSGEFPCPTGQICTAVNDSQSGMPKGNYCLADNCGDCETKTVTDGDGNVLCAPAGTMGADCQDIPVCECKGQFGCQAPCFGVTCDAPLVCTNIGANKGSCVVDNCFNQGCFGCTQVCNDDGGCVENPCANANCQPDEVCKPTNNFTGFECVGSCADVTCPADKVCVDGACVTDCNPDCGLGQVCDLNQMPPTCVDDLCVADACPNGGCCDPIDGSCGACPCEGVVCPDGQTCKNDECVTDMNQGGGGGGGQGGGAAVGGGGQGQGAGSSSGEGGSGNGDDHGVWGLATGGGGCSCRTVAGEDHPEGWIAVAAVGLALSRKRRRDGAKEVAR